MQNARYAKVVLAESETLAFLFGEGIFRERGCERPDVILIDVACGDVPAHAVLRRVRNDARLRGVPVVFLCRNKAEGERAMSAADRPDAYLVKPVMTEGFADIVRRANRIAAWDRNAARDC
jgi:CheY-like chemotaxis protein